MSEMRIRADQLTARDELWTRTWYDTGMQPDEINGWRTVEAVKVAARVTITFADGTPPGSAGPPKSETRFPGDQVQVRRSG